MKFQLKQIQKKGSGNGKGKCNKKVNLKGFSTIIPTSIFFLPLNFELTLLDCGRKNNNSG